MSKPSVWNGRNESILGSSSPNGVADTKDVDPLKSQSSSNVDQASEKGTKKSNAPPTPKKSVWNGKHDKIMEIRDKTENKVPDADTSNLSTPSNGNVVVTVTSPSKERIASQPTNNNIRVAVVSPSPKSDDMKSSYQAQEQSHQAKEDEGTNSTAGSSTTNFDEDASEDVPIASSPPSHHEAKKELGSSPRGAAVDSPGPSSNIRNSPSRTRSSNANAASEAPAARSPRRHSPPSSNTGNNKTVRSNSNGESSRSHHSNNNGNHGSGRQHSSMSRGHSGGSGRRKAVTNGDKPLCAFFMRGMCNRGSSCSFRHDPAYTQMAGASPNNPTIVPNSNGHAVKAGPNASLTTNKFVPSRVFDPLKARAIQLAKEAQDREDRSNFATPIRSSNGDRTEDPPFFSIDVECIATGYGSCVKGINDGCGNEGRNGPDVPSSQYNERSHRYPGRVAMVDTNGNVLADIVIRPPHDGKGVVSYLTPLTGLTEEMCLGPDAKLLEEAVKVIKSLLPNNAVLVGQAIDHDVEWLGLTPGGKDFDHMVDICEIFRQRIPKNLTEAAEALKKSEESGGVRSIASEASNPTVEKESEVDESVSLPVDVSCDEYLGFATRYRSFSLRHVCLNLLGQDIQSGVHDPIIDAKFSLTLFHKYRNSSVTQLRIVRDGLHRAPVTPGFAAEKTPVIDGVCVSAAAYPYKRAARKIWRWYSGKKSS